MMNGSSVSVATVAFGSIWRQMIWRLERPSARAALHIFEIARAQKFGTDDADEAAPRIEEQQDNQQRREQVGLDERCR